MQWEKKSTYLKILNIFNHVEHLFRALTAGQQSIVKF